MPFQPHIVVRDRDLHRDALVVQATPHVSDLPATEVGLKRYMVGGQCPVGMLVTADAIRIYVDTFFGNDEGSVECVGEFRDAAVFERLVPPSARGLVEGRSFQFESNVQSWLESMKEQERVPDLPEGLREAIEQYIFPVLWEGDIWTASPRWPGLEAAK